jgi:hypothetical protein
VTGKGEKERDQKNADPEEDRREAALSSVVSSILEREAGKARPDTQEAARLRAVLQGQSSVLASANAGAAAPARRMRQMTSADTLPQNSRALVGGAASLIYEGLGLDGRTAASMAHELSARLKGGEAGGQVLLAPVCSDYRVTQLERAAENYQKMYEVFWRTASVSGIREQIETIARGAGISVGNVVDEMKPGGTLDALGKRFRDAVKTDPDAYKGMRSLDQALNSFIRQYKYSINELSGTHDEKNRERWKPRIESAKEKMMEMTATVPKASEEAPSHLEKLDATVQAIAEKLKEIFAPLFFSKEESSKVDTGQEDERAPSL